MTARAAAPFPEPVGAPVHAERRGGRISGVVARLTAVNVLASATGFITGPLLAHALGASGRGDLAAIVVPLTLLAGVFGFGIPAYPYRTLPRGDDVGETIGSLGLPLFVVGLVVAAAGVPLADALAGGRPTVRIGLVVVFASAPLLLVGSLLQSSLSALQRWSNVMAARLLPSVVALLGIGTLFALGDLTVATAASVTLAGALLSLAPCLPLLIRRRIVFRPRVARAGIGFGLKAWIGGVAYTANARLDQVLMITFVAPRVLGLYAVAATLAGASGLIAGALSPPLMARTAAGEPTLMAQAVRIMIASTALLNVALALLTPWLLSVLFGPGFRAALPMTLILLAAQIPFNGASVLSSALQADGAPLIPTVAELVALAITIGGLLALLRPLGGVGAAVVSLAAYSASFIFQVSIAHRRIDVRVSTFLVPRRADLRWASSRFGELTERIGLGHRTTWRGSST